MSFSGTITHLLTPADDMIKLPEHILDHCLTYQRRRIPKMTKSNCNENSQADCRNADNKVTRHYCISDEDFNDHNDN